MNSTVCPVERKSFSVESNEEKIELKEHIADRENNLSEILTLLEARMQFDEFKKALLEKSYEKVYTSPVYRSIEVLCKNKNTTALTVGTKVFRARLINDENTIYEQKDGIHFEGNILKGYNWYNSKEPAIGISSEGRANSRYSSYFYCADDESTAASEIKANIGDFISLASFTINNNLQLIILEAKDLFEAKTENEHYCNLIANVFSTPVSASSEYMLTQFISDEIRKHGIDGISYQSHFTHKNNYAIFNCSMDAINFCESKVLQLHSQQLNFIDFSEGKTMSTEPLRNKSEEEIVSERQFIYGMMKGREQERMTTKVDAPADI